MNVFTAHRGLSKQFISLIAVTLMCLCIPDECKGQSRVDMLDVLGKQFGLKQNIET